MAKYFEEWKLLSKENPCYLTAIANLAIDEIESEKRDLQKRVADLEKELDIIDCEISKFCGALDESV